MTAEGSALFLFGPLHLRFLNRIPDSMVTYVVAQEGTQNRWVYVKKWFWKEGMNVLIPFFVLEESGEDAFVEFMHRTMYKRQYET